jgi:hypothetical protein
MENKRKKLLLLIVIITLFVLAVSSASIAFTYRFILEKNEENKGFTAKEGFSLIMNNSKYSIYKDQLTFVEGSPKEDGFASKWIYSFLVYKDGKQLTLNVAIYKNRSITEYESDNFIYRGFINNWNLDSDEILMKAREMNIVKNFYKENKNNKPTLQNLNVYPSPPYDACLVELYFTTVHFPGGNYLHLALDGEFGNLRNSYQL